MTKSRTKIPAVILAASLCALSACSQKNDSPKASASATPPATSSSPAAVTSPTVASPAASSAAATAASSAAAASPAAEGIKWPTGSTATVQAAMWDPNQLPAYEKCAAAFKEKTGITVKYTQQGWDDYWTSITTKFASGSGPDVITMHPNYYPTFAKSGQLLDLTPHFQELGYDPSKYGMKAVDLFVKDGKRYSVPQDQDAEALVVDKSLLGGSDVMNLTWNPTDGGTFGALIKKLTVDKSGKHGDEAGFDKKSIKTYGFALESGGAVQQSGFSFLALSDGWAYTTPDAPFATKFNFDDPKIIETWKWIQTMMKGGFIATQEVIGSTGAQALLDQGMVAMMPAGSWTIGQYADAKKDYIFGKLPKGPVGNRSITNSLGHAVNAATKLPAESAAYVAFTGTPECQDIVGAAGAVFPAIPGSTAKAKAAFEAKGVDVSAFTDLLNDPESTRLYPIVDQAQRISDAGTETFTNKLSNGQGDPATELPKLNKTINDILAEAG